MPEPYGGTASFPVTRPCSRRERAMPGPAFPASAMNEPSNGPREMPRPSLRDRRVGNPVRFSGGALFPRVGGANRWAIPPAILRPEGLISSPDFSPT